MEKLKQIIESTLINNLETTIIYASLDFESLQTTSNIIAQEIKDIAIEFAYYEMQKLKNDILCGLPLESNTDEELFNQFINDKYQE